MQVGHRIAFNTGILYLRILLTSGISLYATRLLLDALGEQDYGIYNLVSGVVLLLSFLNGAMTTSTQRYLSFQQGRSDGLMRLKVFVNSLSMHVMIAFLLSLVLLLLEPLLFRGFLNIPSDRILASRVIYRLMVLSLSLSIVSAPFIALLNARENMLWIAMVNTLEVISKLLISILLYCILYDRLIVYGICMTGILIVSFLFYALYCLRNYEECSLGFRRYRDVSLTRELVSFAGWNLLGALCGVGRSQGLSLLLNLFFGVVVNSSYAIANQVSAQLSFFSSTIMQSFNPQIMKSEGSGDRRRMLRLSMTASKFSFFLLAFFAIPCLFEMTSILGCWLKKVPTYSAVFCILILIGSLTNQLTVGLQSAIQATGKIKIYQGVVGGLLLLNLPVAYMFLRWGYPPYSVFIIFIVVEVIACIARLYFLHKIAGLSIEEYFQKVFIREFFPVFCSILACFVITTYLSIEFRFLLTGILSGLALAFSIYFTGLCPDEKQMIKGIFQKIWMKVK